jgi:hypothetical protein
MPKLTELFAFVVADQDEDDEGVMAFKSGDTWMPMVGTDIKRIEALRPIADSISQQMGKSYRIVLLRAIEEVELQGPSMPLDLTFQIKSKTQKGVTEMSTVLNADDQRKMEMVNCLNVMWDVFSHHIHAEEKEAIEKFIDAKDRAHQLIAMVGKGEPTP